jgi:hypothetical protein
MTIAALSSLLPLPVAIPLAGGVTAPLLARASSRLAVIVSLLAMSGSAAILLIEAPTVFGGRIIAQYLGHWRPCCSTRCPSWAAWAAASSAGTPACSSC